jgi:tetraacyldisaccharide-1-P 4'-kinase
MLTTAKDAVKLRSLQLNFPLHALEIEIEIERSADFRDLILAAVKET